MLPPEKLTIRPERRCDWSAVRAVNQAAFGRPDEADLVDNLRTEGVVLASLVARFEKRIVGHILFSRMLIDTASGPIPAVALAPLAVLPEYQRQGCGERLVRRGLDLIRAQGESIVTVLGHPAYYPRFGFSNDKARTLQSPFPSGSYMAIELVPRALAGVCGNVRYAAAFGIRNT